MNIATFNDIFEAPVLTRHPKKVWDQWKVSPLFEHSMEITKAVDDEKEHIGESLLPLPYPFFRLNLKVTYLTPAEKVVQMDLFVRETESKEWELFYYPRGLKALPDYPEKAIIAVGRMEATDGPTGIEITGEMYDPHERKDWISNEDYEYCCGLGGRNISMADRQKAMYQVYCVMRMFAVDAMSDAVHTAQVRPNKPGKSIEWIKSRTHYTLIHHGHPANTKNLAEGSNVTVDRKEQLTRMAHNRRAHYKTLKHERFRYARGKRIFVKASWVGPKEWKDEGGHQIYRILEEVK